MHTIDFNELMQLALGSAAVDQPCSCQSSSLKGWMSMPLSLPDSQLRDVGTLAETAGLDASYEELLPNGIHYWSDEAPIAPRFFPYNRCTVSACKACGRAFLRYTEGGGYFVDQRIRALDPALLVDAPLA